MSRVLVIGCGGVASVAIQKCCQAGEVFQELCIASRTKAKCDSLAEKISKKTKTRITTAQVDADDVQQVIHLINDYKPDLVMNIALPYQDLTIMDACLACKVNYMDTANYDVVRKKDFPLILITAGSGIIVKNLRKQDLPLYWAAVSTPV